MSHLSSWRTSQPTITRSVPSNFFVDAGSRAAAQCGARFSQRPMLPSVVVPSPLCLLLRSPLAGQQDCAGFPEVGTCVCCDFLHVVSFWGFKIQNGSNVPKQSPTLRSTDRDLFENVTWPPWVCTNERIQMAKISASPGTGQHFGVSNRVARDSAEV